MLHCKNYFVILCSFILLAGCSNQKQTSSSTKTTMPALANENSAGSNETTSLEILNDAYTGSITQTFIAKQKSITTLTAKKGLKVTVNPLALETEDGIAVNGDITVRIIELTTSEELFKSNAATMSNGRLLISGGSYFVGMECNGKKLRLKKNAALQMEFPRMQENEMELFYGKRDVEGNMNWTQAQAPLTFKQQWTAYNPPFPYSDTLWQSNSNICTAIGSRKLVGCCRFIFSFRTGKNSEQNKETTNNFFS